MRFDTSWMLLSNIGPNAEQALTCHELGHSFGLTHASPTADSCMRPAVPLTIKYLDEHERDILDAQY